MTPDLAPEMGTASTKALWASSRDASVWARPNTRSRKRVHVAVNVTDIGRNQFGENERDGEAACDPDRAVLDMSVASLAADIPTEMRCRRPGCAARWPAPPAGQRED